MPHTFWTETENFQECDLIQLVLGMISGPFAAVHANFELWILSMRQTKHFVDISRWFDQTLQHRVGGFKGIASAKPPLVTEITVRMLKFKSLIHQGALAKTEDLTDPVQETSTDRNKGARTRQKMPKVCMEEVPDKEDDTSFQMQKTNLTPLVALEVTQSMVAKPSGSSVKTEKVPHEWLKPFSTEWTLCGIIEARTESEAKVILKNWIHKTHAEEVVNKMIEGMRKATRINALWWLEELLQPK